MMQKRSNEFLNPHEKSRLSDLADYVATFYCAAGSVIPQLIAEKKSITFSCGEYRDCFDGMLEHSYGKFHIYINKDRVGHEYTERARFTFAHELGHYFIDNHRIALAMGLAPSHPSYTGFVSSNLAERQADFFAACLLMPESRIKRDCFKRRFNFSLLQELSKKYQTSMTATALRFAEIGSQPLMVIMIVEGKIKWYSFSKDFPFWSLKYGKARVPENTVAWEYMTHGRRYTSDEIVFASDWFDNLFTNQLSREFYERCVYGSNSNVLSIIWEK